MNTIYGFAMSPYTSRVILACQAGDIPFELSPPPGGLKSDEFLPMSPFGKIPVFKDVEVTLCESVVILDYLDERYDITGNAKSSAAQKAKSQLYVAYADLYLQPAISALFRLWVGGDRSKETAAELSNDVTKSLKVFDEDEHFTNRSLEVLSKADFCVAPALVFMEQLYQRFELPNPLPDLKRLSQYWERLSSHPTIGGHLEVVNELLTKRLDG